VAAAFSSPPTTRTTRTCLEPRAQGDGAVLGGAAGVATILTNRLVLAGELPAPAQSRADLLSLFACFFLILDGLSRRDVEARVAAKVAPRYAARGKGLSAALSPRRRAVADWAVTTLLDALPDAATVVVAAPALGGTIARAGALTDVADVDLAGSPTLRDARSPTYLPDLQALPARVDFPFLPPNAQAALLLPFRCDLEDDGPGGDGLGGGGGLVVVAADRKRAFSPRDQLWAARIADRLGLLLARPANPSSS